MGRRDDRRPQADDRRTASAPEKGPWVFDGKVADRFDDMLHRSIPGLEAMREIVTSLSIRVMDRCGVYEPEDGDEPDYAEVLDLGCSTAAMIEAIADETSEFEPVHFVGVDLSLEMVKRAKRRMDRQIPYAMSDIRKLTLAHRDAGTAVADEPNGRRVLVLAILTLQFMEPMERNAILSAIFNSLEPGGAFIVVEKVDHRSSDAAGLVASSYRDFKMRSYTAAAIDRKDRALEGVLRPRHAEDFERSLRRNFDSVESFWRNRLFQGWIATRKALG